MSLLAVATAATAAPTFVGAPEDVAVASAAWRAATACTGREGSAHERVEIVRKTVPLEYLGVARTDAAGRLYRIDLLADSGRHREVLVHEVTHAWVSEGPPALVEGTAELLADCVVGRVADLAPLQFDDGRSLEGLPDLVRWSKPTDDAPAELHSVRTDAYVGAGRLARTIATVLPAEALWATREVRWDALEARLATAGEPGLRVIAALRGGAPAQRAALADADRDGLTALQEGILGTDDARFDSDGDGWWDGADHPADAVPVPLDGTPVCVGRARGSGGNLRGPDLPEIEGISSSTGSHLARFAELPPAGSTGASWVAAGAEDGCRSSGRATVWAEDPSFAALVAPVEAAVREAMAEADERFGPGPGRVAVALGGARTTVERGVVWLASHDVRGADPEALGRTAVAARRLWAQGVPDWTAVDAYVLALGAEG